MFPVVLKPLALSGSRGVIRADNAEEFEAAFVRLRRLLQEPDIRVERDAAHDQVLVETFVPGREYAVEGVLTQGVFTPFTIFDKPDPLDGPFFEETIYVTPSRASAPVQAAITSAVATAARALGLSHGPVHAECRVNDGGVCVLEVAARPIGGLCSRALRFTDRGHSRSLEEVLLRHALGESLADVRRESDASGVMMIPIPARGVLRSVHGVDDATAVAGIEDVIVTAKMDAMLTPLPEGHSYLGFIFARDRTPERVEAALREAHGRLRFTIDRELPVML
jgi:biotin carboxylase